MKMSAVFAVASLLVAISVPAVSEDSQEQVICNISAKTCQNLVDNLQKRIRKISAEINGGSDKYTDDEMKMLEQKLKDAMNLLDRIEAEAHDRNSTVK